MTWLTLVQACAAARSQLSGSKDADPAATARALQAAAKAGQVMAPPPATELCPVRAVVPARQPSCKPSSVSQTPCDPCVATAPLQQLPDGSYPTCSKVASACKPRARPIPKSDKASGVVAKAEGEAADRTKPAAAPSPVSEKENTRMMSFTHTHDQIESSSSRAQALCAAGAWDEMTLEEITDAF